jgi:hypothetical protein
MRWLRSYRSGRGLFQVERLWWSCVCSAGMNVGILTFPETLCAFPHIFQANAPFQIFTSLLFTTSLHAMTREPSSQDAISFHSSPSPYQLPARFLLTLPQAWGISLSSEISSMYAFPLRVLAVHAFSHRLYMSGPAPCVQRCIVLLLHTACCDSVCELQ